MKQILVFPYGSNKVILDQLKADHPQWMVQPWGFNLVKIESPLDARGEYLSWLMHHKGYMPLLAYYGLTSVLSAFLLIISSLSAGIVSLHVIYGLTILTLIVTHIPVLITLVINRFNHMDLSDLPLLICMVLTILYWFEPSLWFQLLTIQSMILILLWDSFANFVRLFGKKELYRLIRLKEKLAKGQSPVKSNDGQFIAKANETLTVNDEIALKTNDTSCADGKIIHGTAMVKPWYGKQVLSLHAGDTIHAADVIKNGSITFKLVTPLDQSDFAYQLNQLTQASCNHVISPLDPLVISCSALGFIMALLIFGFNPITPTVLLVLTILISWLYPLIDIHQWSNQGILHDTDHGLLPNQILDYPKINEITSVIIDRNLLVGTNNLEVDQVYLTKKLDNTLFFHMVMHALRKNHDECALAIMRYIRNHNLTDTDFRLSQSVYKKGLDNVLDGSTIAYGDLDTLKNQGIDTTIVQNMDNDAKLHGDTMYYLTKDDAIIAIFRLKRPIYPAYRQLVESLKQYGYTTVLYSSTPYIANEYIKTTYGIDQIHDDPIPCIQRIHTDQIRHHRFCYLHGYTADRRLIDAVDLSIGMDTINKLDDLTLINPNPLVLPSWLNHQHKMVHTITGMTKIIPWLIIGLMIVIGLIIPLGLSKIIEPTWLILMPALLDIALSSPFISWSYHIPALKPDHSQSITIRIESIEPLDHSAIEQMIYGTAKDALIKWDDATTLHLDFPSDISRYTICQSIRSNGYAVKLIHEKTGK